MNTALDKANMRGFLEDFPVQIREASNLGQQLKIQDPVNKILIAGAGASGIAGDIVATLLRYENHPVTVVKEHALPNWVNETTLVFIVSHSGDTASTTSCYAEAVRKKAQVVVITSGGKLRFVTREGNVKVIAIPRGLPARSAIAYLLFPMLNVLEASGLTKPVTRDSEAVIKMLENTNYAGKGEQLAIKLKNHIPIIYAGPKLYAAAERWKQMFNENAKIHAFAQQLPDALHHEIMGFDHLTGNYHVILLRDEREHKEVQKQFDFLKEYLKTKDVGVTEIALKGQSSLNKIFSAIHLGDWTSYFLALLHELDPTPTRTIEEWKAWVYK